MPSPTAPAANIIGQFIHTASPHFLSSTLLSLYTLPSISITNRQSFIVMTWHVLLASPPFSMVRCSAGELLPRALLLFSLCPFLQLYHTHTTPFIEILNPNLLCAHSFLTKASSYSPFFSSCSIRDEHYGLKGSVIVGFVCAASGDGCGHSPSQEPFMREGSRLL